MRELLLVVGLLIFGVSLRSCRSFALRKLGALAYLATSYLAFFFFFGTHWAGVAAIFLWLLIPWVELLMRVRKLRFPINNKLNYRHPPEVAHFPMATQCTTQIEEAGFEHVTDSAWDWAGMQQYFRLYWNPEKKQIAALCLCEQDQVAFAFLTLSSECAARKTYRTTNYPFSPTLRALPSIRWHQIPCQHDCFHHLSSEHDRFLQRQAIDVEQLRNPDPERLEQCLENEMREQIDFNFKKGLIKLTGDEHFRYSWRGLFYLWRQIVKDIIRLC